MFEGVPQEGVINTFQSVPRRTTNTFIYSSKKCILGSYFILAMLSARDSEKKKTDMAITFTELIG